MSEAKVKNLILDFGGVLIDLDKARCVARFQALGMADVEQLLDVCHQQGFLNLYEEGRMDDDEFRQHIRRHLGRPATDDEIDSAWNSFLDGIPLYKLDYLDELRSRYASVCLLSNTNNLHWQYACRYDFTARGRTVDDYFDRIFLSYRMKLAKPAPEIFRRVLDETGFRAAETLFVDDSEANCRAARGLGLHTYTPQAREDWRGRL